MPKIKFIRSCRYTETDGPAPQAGDVLEVTDESAKRWIRRGAAELVQDTKTTTKKKGDK